MPLQSNGKQFTITQKIKTNNKIVHSNTSTSNKNSNGDFLLTQAGNIGGKQNEGNIGVNTNIIYRVLIISIIVLITTGFIPGVSSIYTAITNQLALLSIILLGITTYINSITVEKSNEIGTINQTFSIIDRCRTNILTLINTFSVNTGTGTNYTSCPTFINSLYFDFQRTDITKLKTTDFSGNPIIDNSDSIHLICCVLYQNVEDYLNTNDFTWIDYPQILCHFASLFKSPLVQKHWKKNYFIVWYITKVHIDNIIDIVNNYTFNSAYELETFFTFYTKGNKFTNLLGR